MFENSDHIDSSLSTLGNASNCLGNNSVNPLQTDWTGFNSHRLLALAGETLINTWQNQTNPIQALVYTPGDILNIVTTVNQAIDATKDTLTGLLKNPQIDQIMGVSFGANYKQSFTDNLLNNLAKNDFYKAPNIVLISDQTFNGAYATQNNIIYLSQEFVANNLNNLGEIKGVLLEEFGHYIDAKINVQDSPGDEGDIFSRLVQGQSISNDELLSLKSENDGKLITVNGQEIFIEQNTFQSAISSSPVGAGFTKNNGGWTNNNDYPRMLADVNGDGKVDIVGFGASSVFVSLSNGNGTFQNTISSSPVGAGFTKNNGGWTNNNDYPRMLADVNADGKADIVGFAASSVFVSLSNGNGTFQNAISSSPPGAGFTQNNGGWTNNNDYPRMLADVNGDKKADIVGFAANQVLTSFGVTSVAPPVYNPPNRLSQLLNKSTPLTIQEIQESRSLIGQRPDSERGNLYSQLQYKTPYFNQRDNGYKDIADVMCNVTTLANCLTSLGVQNPNSSKQFEDVLEDRLRNDPNKYPSSNGTNARYWWSNLSKLAESFGVRSSGTKSLQGFSSSDTKFFQDFVRNNWESGLRQGKAVMAGVYTTQPGHIIRVVGVDWQRGGLVIDDPYGRAQDTAGSDYKRNNYNRSGISDTRNTSSRTNVNTQEGQDEAGNGKQNFWSWSYCAEVFGNTWYLILG